VEKSKFRLREGLMLAVTIFPKSSPIWFIGLVLYSVGFAVGPSLAQSPPNCTQAVLGQVACMSVKLCECIFERGGTMTGRPSGYRWDCGILRPQCNEAPVTIIEHRGNAPSHSGSVSYDQSDDSVTVNQDGTNTNSNSSPNTNTNTNPNTNLDGSSSITNQSGTTNTNQTGATNTNTNN
jgi:hypothetical protein